MHDVNVERVQLWIQALRSGEYEQGQGHLRLNQPFGAKPRYCCLGVAQEVALRNGWVSVDVPNSDWLDWGPAAMPADLGRWFGFMHPHATDPPLVYHQDQGDNVCCTMANDDLNWTFEQIADALEARYITGTDTDNIDGES
jgi:hypothetical protein